MDLLSLSDAEIILAFWLKQNVSCSHIVPLQGGMIYNVFRLEFSAPPFSAVIKTDCESSSPGFEREINRLAYLKQHTRFPAPRPYCRAGPGECMPFSFILMESLPGFCMSAHCLSPADRCIFEEQLADILIDLHSHTRQTFGDIDLQPGYTEWQAIFVPKLFQLRQDLSTLLASDVLHTIDQVLSSASSVFSSQGIPTLVHGDIWSGNIMLVEKDGKTWISGIVDAPAVQFADPEYEMAYLEVFTTVSTPFFNTYTSVFPLRPGYELRKLYYWLHTWMLHVWLFNKPHYHKKTTETVCAILSAL